MYTRISVIHHRHLDTHLNLALILWVDHFCGKALCYEDVFGIAIAVDLPLWLANSFDHGNSAPKGNSECQGSL